MWGYPLVPDFSYFGLKINHNFYISGLFLFMNYNVKINFIFEIYSSIIYILHGVFLFYLLCLFISFILFFSFILFISFITFFLFSSFIWLISFIILFSWFYFDLYSQIRFLILFLNKQKLMKKKRIKNKKNFSFRNSKIMSLLKNVITIICKQFNSRK